MNRILTSSFLISVLSLLAGCGSAMRITHASASQTRPSQVDGIPFYVKVGACKHETIWLEPTFKISLSKSYKLNGQDVTEGIGSKILSFKDYNSDEFRRLVLSFEKSKATSSEDVILDIFIRLKDYVSPTTTLPATENRLLASNKNEPTSFVNYGDVYYYNVKRPILGSVTASSELSSDGTLSKATATIEDKTLQAFLDLIPVKDVVSTAAKGALGIAATDGGTALLTLKLTIEPQTYQYTLYTIGSINPSSPCAKPGPALTATEDVNFARTVLSATDDSKKDDIAKKVKFSGSVDVPK